MKARTKTGQITKECRKTYPYWILVLFLASLFISFKTQAQTAKNFATKQPFLFEENKGQLRNASGNVLSDVKYYGKDGGVYVYCKEGILSFVFTKTEKEPEQISEATGTARSLETRQQRSPLSALHSSIFTSRMDLILLGSNPNSQITAIDQQEYYVNFYTTGDADHGITNVHTYKTLTYKNIYPHIDMILSVAKKGMEYSFLVHPGGNVSDIKLRWDGAEKEEALKNGGIKYANMLGNMEESAPKSFVEGKEVKSRFVKKDAQFSFKIESYDTKKDLLIDPSLTWATYFGGSGEDHGTGIMANDSENVYLTGFTQSTSSIATKGAYQTSNAGNYDIFLSKFNIKGAIIWSTYYGGSSDDEAYGIVLDNLGNSYITGYTASSSGIATSVAYQTSFGGGEDAFLAKFNNNGFLNWGSYYGGSGTDAGSSIAMDASGFLYMTGSTNSTAGIATNGSYQASIKVYSTGQNNAFLAKFDTSGASQWATYYGGGITTGNGIATDNFGNAYIVGTTEAASYIATSGAFQTTGGGTSNDGFVAKFSGGGGIIWGTYYGGIYTDEANAVATDSSGNVYVTGMTFSPSGLASSGAFQTSISGATGNSDAFLVKFTSSGTRQWGTYYGNTVASTSGVTCSNDGKVYIVGTSKYSGIATSGAYQTSNAGQGDVFLAQFDISGNPSWATYFGGSGNDDGAGITSDSIGNIYLTGVTSSTSNIATSGVHQSSFGGGSYDAFIAKFNFEQPNAGVTALVNPTNPTCPGTASIKVSLKNFNSPTITSAEIAWGWNGVAQTNVTWTGTLNQNDSTTVDLGTVTLVQGIKMTIKAWPTQVNSNANPGGPGDTLSETIIVDSLPLASTGSNSSICSGSSISIGGTADAGSTYSWASSPSGFTSTSSNPSISPSVKTKYYLTETSASGCSAKDSTTITVNPSPKAEAGNNETICTGNSVTLGSTPETGSAYVWVSTPPGFTSTASNPTVSPKTTTSYTITEINSYGCVNSNSITVTIGSCPKTSAGNDAGIGAITSPTSTFCGNMQAVHVRLKNYGSNELDSAKIGWSVNSKPQTAVNWTGKLKTGDTAFIDLNNFNFLTGNDTIKAWAYMPNGIVDSVPQNDTSIAEVISYAVPMPNLGISNDTTVCHGAVFSIGRVAITGDTYKWISNGSVFSTKSNPIVTLTKTASYSLYETNQYGCEGFSTVTINVVSAGFSFAQSCLGDSTGFTISDPIPTYYKWSFGDGKTSTAKNPMHLYAGLGTYSVILKDSSSSGCSDSVSKTVTISTCVWPGDANFDKVDNTNDILTIGLAYGDTGSKRTDTTTQWYAHPCTDWSKNFASGANHKHADCNGDGTVNLLDVSAIVRNYSQTHSKTSGTSGGNPSDPALSLSIAKDSVGTSDTLSIQMNLGTSSKPVSDIYGLCFSVTYDPINVNKSKGITADFSKCWLGTLNKDLIYLLYNDTINNVIDIGLVRTDHNNVSGYGSLGILSIILPDNVGGKREVKNELHFDIENVKAINFAENDIPLYTLGDSVLFYGYKSGIASSVPNLNQVRVYPNPTNSILHLDAGKDFILGITISNLLGENILSQKYPHLPQTDLNVENLSAGTYFIDIQTDNGIARSRFVKN